MHCFVREEEGEAGRTIATHLDVLLGCQHRPLCYCIYADVRSILMVTYVSKVLAGQTPILARPGRISCRKLNTLVLTGLEVQTALHAGRSTGGSQIFFILTCAQY